jgi:hypothetical protein
MVFDPDHREWISAVQIHPRITGDPVIVIRITRRDSSF